jgi:hypothetical protein
MDLSSLEQESPLQLPVSSVVYCSGSRQDPNVARIADTEDLLSYPDKPFSRFDYVSQFTATLFKKLISTEVFIAGINGARIVTPRYIVIGEGDRIIGETIPRNPRNELIRSLIRRHAPESLRLFAPLVARASSALSGPCHARINGVSALLGQANNNYGHWHMDVLPSLALLQELGIDKRVTLLTSELKSYRRRSLELLSVDFDRVRVIPGETLVNQHVFCERLLFPSPLSVNYGHVPFWQQHVYDRVLKALWRQHGILHQSPKRIYVDRSNDKKRRCLNEPELTKRLQAIGFQVVRPAELSYDEQVLMFANADVIVGCMGAGLVNVVFARRGAVIIELKPPQHQKTALWKTYATLAGANHHALEFGDIAIVEHDTWAIPDVNATVNEIQRLI